MGGMWAVLILAANFWFSFLIKMSSKNIVLVNKNDNLC